MTTETLTKILADHKTYLKTGNMALRANLSGANLSDADLRAADLRYANLSAADLRDADLRDADLRDAYLRGADLRYANLIYANLSGANLRDANLRGANLRGADLSGAHLSNAIYDGFTIFVNSSGLHILSATYGRHQAISIDDRAAVGCELHELDFWVKHYKQIGKEARYTEDEIRVYGNILKFFYKTRKARGVIK